ncbi:MAG TPA: hypothetical protein VJ785_06655 [Anaerolineales bacterium]|nr:hypothetical protein [Anaerolineales bacterium]
MAFRMKLLKYVRQMTVIGLVIFSLIVSYKNAASVAGRWDPAQPFNNPVDKWEKRINRIKNFIPEDVTLIGYVADWDLPGIQYNLVDQDAEYMLTQYALAPIQVKPGLDPEWVIGNFTTPGFEDWLDKQLQSYEIIDLDQGIYIIHRNVP